VKVFDFDPADHAGALRDQGYVHIREGVTREFHEFLVDYARQELGDHLLPNFAIKGKKEQALFEFPRNVDYPGELFDVVSATTGLDRDGMTLSERHIQAYEANAAPEPPAHKDRFPSQVSVGLSVSIPAESRLVLYPYSHREINPFNTSAGLYRQLQPHEKPEIVLSDAREVELDDRDRDVVIFPGSTTWHLRRRAAGSLNLYLKFNDFGCDPLGEDPYTEPRREATLAAVQGMPQEQLDGLVPVIGRRFDTVARVFTRAGWEEALQVRTFGEEPFGITEAQYSALRAADGRTLAELVESLPGDPDEARRQALLLAENGALDLVPPHDPAARHAPASRAAAVTK
jgi:hypothetical protein